MFIPVFSLFISVFSLFLGIIIFIYFSYKDSKQKKKINSDKILMYLCIYLTILELYIILYPISFPNKWSMLRSNELQYCATLVMLLITFLFGLVVSLKYIKLRDISYLISGVVCSLIYGTGFILYLYHFIYF
jgi:membrane-associated HD superfamily phosphohydrolase